MAADAGSTVRSWIDQTAKRNEKITLEQWDSLLQERDRKAKSGSKDQQATNVEDATDHKEVTTNHLGLPLGPNLDAILRYETTIDRQMYRAIDQLERMQRARKWEHVPAPVTLDISTDR